MASIAAPLTTQHIQSPTRFLPAHDQQQQQRTGVRSPAGSRGHSASQRQGLSPLPSSPSGSPTGGGAAVRQFEGTIPRVMDTQPHPISASSQQQQQQGAVSPGALGQMAATRRAGTPPSAAAASSSSSSPSSSAPTASSSTFSPSKYLARINPNVRSSAGFPLAVPMSLRAAEAARFAAAQAQREAEQEELIQQAQVRAQAETEAKAAAFNQAGLRASVRALYEQQQRDCKVPYRERVAPPRPLHGEDPLTARATEHTANWPGPINRVRRELPPLEKDEEPMAPKGSPERAAQKLRSNPLLDSRFVPRTDAAGLGYGRTHPTHFKYLSPYTTGEEAVELTPEEQQQILTAFRSKDGRGYRPEVRSLGYGYAHPVYNQYVNPRRAEDVLKDYPNREACEKHYNRKS